MGSHYTFCLFLLSKSYNSTTGVKIHPCIIMGLCDNDSIQSTDCIIDYNCYNNTQCKLCSIMHCLTKIQFLSLVYCFCQFSSSAGTPQAKSSHQSFLYRPTIDSDEFTALPDTLENSLHITSNVFNCVSQLSVG